MRQELVFKIKHNNYAVGMHYFKRNKKPININDVDTNKIVLSNKVSYGKQGANKYYIGYLSGDFKPLCIIIKKIKLYTDHMSILANNKEFLKYIKYVIRLRLYLMKNLIKEGCIADLQIIMNT